MPESEVHDFHEPKREADEPMASEEPLALGLADDRTTRQRRWNRLESLTVDNFKAIERATIPLSHVTILVGPNGSGKSSMLQAVHWAARAASYISLKNTKEMMSFERMDYLPSSEPLRTSHKTELKSGGNSQPTGVTFAHQPLTGEKEGAKVAVRIFAARNNGGITAHIDGGAAVTPYKQRAVFITAYIPGLAGLSERETLLAQPPLRRQAASGDAGSVLRNILLTLSARRLDESDDGPRLERLKQLNDLVAAVHPSIRIAIHFNEREDTTISATYTDTSLPGRPRTLETLATGVLQVIQIFAYLILFRPRLLLIDEPDAHLHPDKQERLIEALESAARRFDTQIILTTHSPYILRAASQDINLVWMKDGAVESKDVDSIRRLLGWGGLDKEALFFIEDEDDKAIRSILSQWPALVRRIAICRCFGIANLPKDKLLAGLLLDGEIKMRALIHRDGDFMNELEKKKWAGIYTTPGVHTWITQGNDVESYFCEKEYLSKLYGVSHEVAEKWRSDSAAKVTGAKDTFENKRKEVVRVIWSAGGGTPADELWTAEGQCVNTVLGKSLWKQLKNVVKAEGHDDSKLDKFEIPENYAVADDLRISIEKSLAGALLEGAY